MGSFNVTTNATGVPYFKTSTANVTADAVSLVLGFRRIPPVGYFTVKIDDAIPTGTTGTLPVSITLNGTTRALTFFNGTPVTAADLTGTGVISVFNDRFGGILLLMSPQAAA